MTINVFLQASNPFKAATTHQTISHSNHFVLCSMMTNQANISTVCQKLEGSLFIPLFLLICVLPTHLLMAKILYRDCQLALPRHKIMLSLTVSDALQIFAASITIISGNIINGTKYGGASCKYIEGTRSVLVPLALFVSSVNIISLCIERYISCIHSLYVYHIMTTKRVVLLLGAEWVIGTVIGAVSFYLTVVGGIKEKESLIIQRVSVLITFPSATIILFIQLRLLYFSRSKLARVKPVGAFGNQAEMVDFRRRQVKVTFVASIVAIAYIVCMFPITIANAWEWHHGEIKNASLKSVLLSLGLLNTMFDPLFYGLGIGETRRMVWKNIKHVKEFFLLRLCNISAPI